MSAGGRGTPRTKRSETIAVTISSEQREREEEEQRREEEERQRELAGTRGRILGENEEPVVAVGHDSRPSGALDLQTAEGGSEGVNMPENHFDAVVVGHRKAEQLISKGQAIRILSENDFQTVMQAVGADSV